jgi:hypothetical protein
MSMTGGAAWQGDKVASTINEKSMTRHHVYSHCSSSITVGPISFEGRYINISLHSMLRYVISIQAPLPSARRSARSLIHAQFKISRSAAATPTHSSRMACSLRQPRRSICISSKHQFANQDAPHDCNQEANVVGHDGEHPDPVVSLQILGKSITHWTYNKYPIKLCTTSSIALMPFFFTFHGAHAVQGLRRCCLLPSTSSPIACAPCVVGLNGSISCCCCSPSGLEGRVLNAWYHFRERWWKSWRSTFSTLNTSLDALTMSCFSLHRRPSWLLSAPSRRLNKPRMKMKKRLDT